MAANLPQFFTSLNEFTTSSKGAVVLYGRRTDGTLVAVNVDANGNLTAEPISGANETLVRVAFGAIPNNYGAGAQLTATGNRNHLFIRNDTDNVILVSLDGTNDHFIVKSGEGLEFSNVTILAGSNVRISYDTVAPTSGEATISAWSDK